MYKKLTLAILLFTTLTVFSQKKKVVFNKDNNMIEVNGRPYAKIEKENASGQLGINKNYIVKNLEGEDLIYLMFKQKKIYDAWGEVAETKSFYQITFVGSSESSKKNGTLTSKGVAKLIANHDLIVEGEIDPEAERKFHLKY